MWGGVGEVSLHTPLDTLYFFLFLRLWVAWILGNYNLWWRSFSNDSSISNSIPIPISTGWSGTRSACLYCFWIETRLRNKGRNVEWHLREGFYAVLVAFHEPISNSCVFCSLATKELECTLPLASQGFPFHVCLERSALRHFVCLGRSLSIHICAPSIDMVTSSCGQLSLIPM